MKWLAITCLTVGLGIFLSYPQQEKNNVDPIFSTYLESFILEGRKYGTDLQKKASSLRINFGELGENKAGSCKKQAGYSQVTINKAIWDKMDSLQKQVLIFHELGHCLLGRKHRNDLLPRGECASLLVESQNQTSCFCNYYSKEWKEYYLRELFTRKADLPQWYWKDTSFHIPGVRSEIALDTTRSRSLSLFEPYTILTENHQLNFYIPELQGKVKVLMHWQSLRITLDPKQHTLAIDTHTKYPTFRKKIPRLVYFHLPKVLPEIISIRTYQGFYDVFFDGEHVYKTKADFPEEKNQKALLFTMSTWSKHPPEFRVELSNLTE